MESTSLDNRLGSLVKASWRRDVGAERQQNQAQLHLVRVVGVDGLVDVKFPVVQVHQPQVAGLDVVGRVG